MLGLPEWWNGIHSGFKTHRRKACEFESRLRYPGIRKFFWYNAGMANYSFTVNEGQDKSFSLGVFGLAAGLDAKLFLDGVERSASITTAANVISVTVPAAISSLLPARYSITASGRTIVSGTIYVNRVEEVPPPGPVTENYATIDADGDVVNGHGEKIRSFLILGQSDPVPESIRDNTVVLRILP